MPRPRPQYVQRRVTRHGRIVWYVRVGRGPLVRLRAPYGSPEFMAEYQAAIAGQPVVKLDKGGMTLRRLWEAYMQSSVWKQLSPETRRQRQNIMAHVLDESGEFPITKLTRKAIVAGRDRRADRPAAARHFLDTIKGMCAWATDAEHFKADPAIGIKAPKPPKGGGMKVWTEDEVERYETKWPLGTNERVWLDVLVYTGLRRGDAVLLGKQHCSVGPEGMEAALKTEKSGETVEVTIPILPVLQRTFAAGPIGDLAFIVGKKGRPFVKESFGNQFKDACRAAGIDEDRKAAHGLRKVAATRCAENGATVHQMMALFGWLTEKEAILYTKKANRKRLAREAMHTLNKPAEPAPSQTSADVLTLLTRRGANAS